MPTPLETHIQNRPEVSYLRSAFAIGSDNAGSTMLRDAVARYTMAMPQTLAGYCLAKGTAWSQPVNDAWVGSMVNDPEIKTVIIAHARICEAITRANDNGTISAPLFDAHFGGNRGPTYTEIIAIMGAGFTDVEMANNTLVLLTRR